MGVACCFLWGFGLFIIADVHNCAGNFITFVKVIACVDGQLRLTPFFELKASWRIKNLSQNCLKG